MSGRAPSGRPSAADLEAARGKVLADLLAPGLDVLFCGINPGLWSAAVGHHFGRPGNRFWQALADAGFTDSLLAAADERRLLDQGIGLTDLVARTTARASELTVEELRRGALTLEAKAREFAPRFVAIVGIEAYRKAFAAPAATVGEQEGGIAASRLWVLPNPSGLNAHYQREDLARAFTELRRALAKRSQG